METGNAKIFLETLKASGVREIFIPVTTKKHAAPKRDESLQELKLLREQVLGCSQCSELVRNRHTIVFGSGNPKADLLFVGEAPGAEEDRQGLPFVGPAGQLLTKMIQAIQLSREEVFIANVLKCRPPGNRPPKPQEIENCEPFLKKQISLVRPKLICALGTFAAQTILKTATPISALRGRFHQYEGIPVLCTFHPSYLLRSPNEKKRAWEDLKKVRAFLDELKKEK